MPIAKEFVVLFGTKDKSRPKLNDTSIINSILLYWVKNSESLPSLANTTFFPLLLRGSGGMYCTQKHWRPIHISFKLKQTAVSPNNVNMKYDVREGTYVGKRGKEFMDYLIQCGKFVNCLQIQDSKFTCLRGCPPSDAKNMMEKGMTMKAEVSKIGDKKWRGVITCEEVPKMNDTHVYEEDKEVCIDDPLFGGKLKVKMTCPDENTIEISLDHSKMGKGRFLYDVCKILGPPPPLSAFGSD